MIDPLERYAQRFQREAEGGFGMPEIFAIGETLTLVSLPDLQFPLWEIFGEPAPQENPADIAPAQQSQT